MHARRYTQMMQDNQKSGKKNIVFFFFSKALKNWTNNKYINHETAFKQNIYNKRINKWLEANERKKNTRSIVYREKRSYKWKTEKKTIKLRWI